MQNNNKNDKFYNYLILKYNSKINTIKSHNAKSTILEKKVDNYILNLKNTMDNIKKIKKGRFYFLTNTISKAPLSHVYSSHKKTMIKFEKIINKGHNIVAEYTEMSDHCFTLETELFNDISIVPKQNNSDLFEESRNTIRSYASECAEFHKCLYRINEKIYSFLPVISNNVKT